MTLCKITVSIMVFSIEAIIKCKSVTFYKLSLFTMAFSEEKKNYYGNLQRSNY